jgi:hypothetical protein
MQFLQMKKLLLDLEVLKKEKNLSVIEFPGEARILAELKESGVAAAKSPEKKISYLGRLGYSLLGGFVFFLIAALFFAFGRFHEQSSVLDSAKFLLREFGFSALCGLLASFIPLGNRRASFLYGLTMPLVLGLLIVSVEAPRHLDSAR